MVLTKNNQPINKKGKIEKSCSFCNSKFFVYPYRLKTAKFCSPTCRYHDMNGRKQSDVTRIRMSGKSPWNKGIKYRQISGEKHHNWKGGISKTASYHNFYSNQYKIRKRGAFGSFSIVEWETLKSAYGYMCLCCKQREPDIRLEADHVIPISRGGGNTIDNIQPLCRSCNAIKNTKSDDFRIDVDSIHTTASKGLTVYMAILES